MMELNLKKELQSVRAKAYNSSHEEVLALLPAMLEQIGSLDAELRDDLIYSTFVNWIYDQRLFSTERLHAIVSIVLDKQHMFYRMGEKEDDGVFTRAFSVLLLPLLLGVHRDNPYLSLQELNEVKTELIRFLRQEQDKRGFVKDKGWAHAIAHAADAVDELALCTEMGQVELLEMLAVIRGVICDSSMSYTHGEEERLVSAVISILQRGILKQAEVCEWVNSFTTPVLAIQALPDKLLIRANGRNFLQSLFFRLRWKGMLAPFESALEQTLRSISFFVE
ncbi:MAG: DUF2785 domain-containing protein [Anaerolineaceae bacterium]